MRRTLQLFILLSFFISDIYAGNIADFIKSLPVKNIEVLEKESFYSHIYELKFEQLLDHNNPDAGTFLQRIYVSHVDESRPMVMVTEGYTAGYYYTSEPATLLKCNQIIVEHRYFGESQPDSIQWEYLNTWQAASDHHTIIEAFKEFYTDKWITTGISKGGQTVMFHSYYYPNDVDVRIPYVAPLNNALEDQRVYSFLDHVGSGKCRRKIHAFQKHALKHQDQIRPEFIEYSKKKGYTYDLIGGYEKAFEYCVLEYSFAFWQWGYSSCMDIPNKKDSPEDIIIHMNQVAGFDYFADEFVLEYQPFFFQANTEMGYYGYDLSEFKSVLRHATEPGFLFTMPKDYNTSFSDTMLKGLNEYITNSAENYIFIYGEYDTWSSTAVELSGNTNSQIFYKKKGSHRTRIRNMPEEQQEEIFELLDHFLQ